jgi:hypothetical protein
VPIYSIVFTLLIFDTPPMTLALSREDLAVSCLGVAGDARKRLFGPGAISHKIYTLYEIEEYSFTYHNFMGVLFII